MHSRITPISIADFIAERLAAIDKTMRHVASECGLENARARLQQTWFCLSARRRTQSCREAVSGILDS